MEISEKSYPSGPYSNVLSTGEIIPSQDNSIDPYQNSDFSSDAIHETPQIFATDKNLQTLELINEIKKYPCLYDAKDPLHKDNDHKTKLMMSIAMKLNTNPAEVHTRWSSLRRQYRRERVSRLNSRPTPMGKRRRAWPFYEHLNFLKHCLNERRLAMPDEVDDSIDGSSSVNFEENPGYMEENIGEFPTYVNPNDQISSILEGFCEQNETRIKREVIDFDNDTPNIDPTQVQALENDFEYITPGSNLNFDCASSNDELPKQENPVTIVSFPAYPDPSTAGGSRALTISRVKGDVKSSMMSNGSSSYSTPILTNGKGKSKASATSQPDETLDADLAFGRAVGLELQRMDEYQRALAKIKIQEVLLNARFKASNS